MAARGKCLLLVVCWIFVPFLTQIEAVTYSVAYQTLESCGSNQYFDLAGLRCRDCDSVSQTKSSDGLSCQCRSTYRTVNNVGGPSSSLVCQACGSGQVSTIDGWNCIDCQTQECESCVAGEIGVEFSVTGALQNTRSCETCDARTLPNAEGTQCERCHQSLLDVSGDCTCNDPYDLADGLCFQDGELKPQAQDTFQVSYEAFDNPETSYFFEQHLLAAEAMCRLYKNLTACQLLGNLCVLLYYNPNSENNACNYFQSIRTFATPLITDNPDWIVDMPWLRYTIDPADDVLTEIDIPTKFSAEPTSEDSTLKLFVAIYSSRGEYQGLTSVNGGVIQLCKDTVERMDAAYIFGTTYSSSCQLKAQDLWNNYDTTFYDMYLQYTDGGSTQLYGVPVLLDNYQDSGTFENRQTSRTNWQLTRRFFLVDNVSGQRSANGIANVIRYVRSIELVITLQNVEGETREGKIYPPLLKISYGELVYEDDYDANTDVTVTFRVTYEMSRAYGENALSTALGIISGLGVIWAAVRSNAWRRRAGLIYIDVKTMFKFLFFSFGMLGNVFFICIFGTSLYWLLFFKRQGLVYLVLPTPAQEESFIWYLCFAFVFKALDVLHLVVYQCLTDIFLIDWERSRGRVVQSSDPGSSNKGNVAPVSIWRTFFVANEWNELQEMRRSNIFFQMSAMLFFLEVIGMKNLTTMDPRSSVYVDPSTYTGDYSRVLRFALAAGLYLLLSLLQWMFFAFIYERFVEDNMRNFVDLCSMANISVFVLTDSTFGYYIHGRSVHGFADTDLKEVRDQLKREEDNLCGQRGLLPNSEQQTFEMLLPKKFRDQYNTILQPLDGVAARIDGTRGRPDASRNPDGDKSIQAYQTMNRFLGAFLDHGIRDIDYVVKDKLLFEQILDMEFYDPAEKGFFYNDGGHSFDNALFYGNESTLQLFELLLFCLIDLMAANYVLAAIITYLGSTLLVKIRAAGGRANLAKKTLVDERFLI